MRIKVLGLILFFTIILSLFPVTVFGLEFTDMPNNWSGPALEKAVSNGLLNGDNGKIRPQDNLTRAEMATIINIAFNASEKSSLTKFSDVSQGKWYYEEMAKAVQMQTFAGNGEKLNPQQNITREEAFVVLANAFKIAENERTSLNIFFDKNDISKWAIDATSALVSEGYVAGSNGNVNPKSNITRAEFAQIMDNLIKTYITQAGEYKADIKGNVMVNVSGVTLKGITITGDLIIGDGVGKGEVILEDTTVAGRVLVRGGGENSIKILGNSNIKNILIAKINGKVRIHTEDEVEIEEIIIDGKDDVILEGDFNSVLLGASDVTLFQNNAKIELIVVTGSRVKIVVDTKSYIDKVLVNANDVKIEGNGKIREVAANGDNIVVTVIGTKVTVNSSAQGVFAAEKKVLPGKTQIVTEVAPSSGEKNSRRGGSFEEGGSQGGSRNKETPEVPVPEVPVPQVPVPEVPVPEVPVPEVPAPQVPVPQVPVTLRSISVTMPATKLIYNIGETLDISGMVVTGTYSNATTKAETVTISNITGFDSSQAELCQTLTITIGAVTTSFEVEIKAEINAISDINNAIDAAGISQAITMHSVEIGLNLADYNLLTPENKVIVQTALIGKSFVNNTEVNTAFETSVSVLIINELAPTSPVEGGDAKMESALTRYKGVLSLDKIPYDTYIATSANTKTFKSHVNDVLRAAVMNTPAEVRSTFAAAVTAEAVHTIHIQGKDFIDRDLRTYAAILGLDFTDYDTLGNKNFVQTAMVAQPFKTTAQIKEFFNSVVAQQKALQALTLLDAFNNASDTATMGNVITFYSTLFNPNDFALYCDSIGEKAKSGIQNEMLRPTFQTNEDVQVAFAIALLNNVNELSCPQIFRRNVILFGLSSSRKEFESLTLDESKVITKAVTAARPIADKIEILVTVFNTTTLENYMGTLIQYNNALLGLNMQDYNVLINKAPIHSAMISALLTNTLEVKTAFDSAVLAQKIVENPVTLIIERTDTTSTELPDTTSTELTETISQELIQKIEEISVMEPDKTK